MVQQVQVLEARPDDLSSNLRTPRCGSRDHSYTQNAHGALTSFMVYEFFPDHQNSSFTLSVSMAHMIVPSTLDCEQVL